MKRLLILTCLLLIGVTSCQDDCMVEAIEEKPVGGIAFMSWEGDIMNSGIYIINPDGTGKKRLTAGLIPLWSPDAKQILFISNDFRELRIINADGTGERKIFSIPERFWIASLRWATSGKIVMLLQSWVPSAQRSIYTINVDGSYSFTQFLDDKYDRNFVFSPDGKKIAYFALLAERNFDIVFGLYVSNLNGTGKVNIYDTISLVDTGFLEWSPDGSKFAYAHGIIGSDGTGRIDIVRFEFPSWSPNGRKLVAKRDDNVFFLNADGTGETQISTLDDVSLRGFSWSPDAQRIVCWCQDDSIIYILNIDGSSPTKLTSGIFPQWSPR